MTTRHTAPHAAESPKSSVEQLGQHQQRLLALLADILRDCHPEPGAMKDLPQITVPANLLPRVCRRAKTDPRLGFKMLLCMCCVDYKDHLQLVYILHSAENEWTLAVKANLPAEDPHAPTVITVWQAADWYERETHDLFGVVFDGHPDLSPLLLYEGFEGHPGLKSFPFHEYQEF